MWSKLEELLEKWGERKEERLAAKIRRFYAQAAKTIARKAKRLARAFQRIDNAPGSNGYKATRKREEARTSDVLPRCAVVMAAAGVKSADAITTDCGEVYGRNAVEPGADPPPPPAPTNIAQRVDDLVASVDDVPPVLAVLELDTIAHDIRTDVSGYRVNPYSKLALDDVSDPVACLAKLTEALNRNLSGKHGVDELAKDIAEATGYNMTRSLRIARTERTRAQNAARWEELMRLNRTDRAHKTKYRKMWIARNDDRTRDSHADMSGQMRYVTEPFISGAGHELMYPGDPNAPPEEVINCRCYMRRVHPDDVAMYGG